VRVGILFICPVKRVRHDGTPNPAPHRMACFFQALPRQEQCNIVVAEIGEDAERWTQLCREDVAWTCTPEAGAATFDNISITPSIDGGTNSWHGYITNGEIK